MSDPAGEADLGACRAVIRHHGRSFSYASRFLPEPVRDDVAVVYAYYRRLDDLVDASPAALSRDRLLAVLDDWDCWLAAGAPVDAGDVIRRTLPAVIRRRGLMVEDLRVLLRGLRGDVHHHRPATMAALESYCFEVAGSVGLVMADLLGAVDRERARPAAAAMGCAMQLTNVCRDVDEDLARGRVYLPVELCCGVGCDDSALEQRRSTPGVRAAVAEVAGRARALYAQGSAGLPLLPRETRLCAAVAARAYAAILDRLAARDHDVFAGRVATTRRARWVMAARLVAGRGLRV